MTVVIGAFLVHSDGVDFTRLEPTHAAVGLTLAIPFVYAATLPLLADRWLRADSTLLTTSNRLAYVPLLVWVFPLFPSRGAHARWSAAVLAAERSRAPSAGQLPESTFSLANAATRCSCHGRVDARATSVAT